MDQKLINNSYRHQTVLLEGEHSIPCKVLSGIPQGTDMIWHHCYFLFTLTTSQIP